MKTILVCGGRGYGAWPLDEEGRVDREHPEFHRKYRQYYHVISTLDVWSEHNSENLPPPDREEPWLPNGIQVISGGQRGVDTIAIEWAIVNWVPFEEFPADWKKYGPKAGPIRNKQMLVKGKPDIVMAFPGGPGTANMVKLAKKAGVEVIEVIDIEEINR